MLPHEEANFLGKNTPEVVVGGVARGLSLAPSFTCVALAF